MKYRGLTLIGKGGSYFGVQIHYKYDPHKLSVPTSTQNTSKHWYQARSTLHFAQQLSSKSCSPPLVDCTKVNVF